ncbi:heme/hemin ABC transporter substrate-binding protein [Comamonas flocculans]|uniref:ABC transporter substrate-binding protein n=1 Tax=Comamonas flocculans TaxID=2597701 RepID=A0A5B8RVT2_9BURK|nr:ABC transporter substrate-binding protein [Comamonas flocculans]QEA12838.1 ABC transporter substrate-binding protein [Comamonas flocculans]
MRLRRRLLLATPLLALGAGARAAQAQRVVSLGGVVTEIVHALGADERLVGVDQSSLYPPAARALPQVGYFRSFAVEGVLSLRPDLVLASEQAGPPHALEQLRAAGVAVVLVASSPKVSALESAIDTVAATLRLNAEGQARARRLRQQLDEAARPVAHDGAPPRVLILSSHTGRLQAAGAGSAPDALLTLAGGANAFGQPGYKAISAEAVAAAQPDAILTSTLSIDAAGGLAGFTAQPGIAMTPAAQSGRIIVLDDLLLLGFGPRLPLALAQVRSGLFGPAARGAA